MNGQKSKKNLKFTTLAWGFAIMLLAIVILINVAVSFFDIKLDMTTNHMYTMSDTSKDYLKNLNKDVDIYLLMELEDMKNQKDSGDIREFITLIEDYDSFEHITLHDIDPNENPDILNELNPDNYLNLKEGDIVVKCGDVSKKIPASDMYYYDGEYDSSGNFTATSKIFYGENIITGAVKAVVDEFRPSVYFLAGHGEKTIEDNFTTFTKSLKNNNYEAKELDLTSAVSVPEDAAIIIEAAPQVDISADEKKKLDDYLDKGGNLSLLMSPLNTETDFENLLDIMHEYCIGMDYDIVYETDTSRHLSNNKYQITAELVDINSTNENTGANYDITGLNTSTQSNKDLTDLTSQLINDTANLAVYLPESRTFFEYNGANYNSLNICPLMQTSDTAKVEAYGGTKHRESDKEISAINMNSTFWLSAYSEDPTRNNSKIVVMPNAEFIDDSAEVEAYATVPFMLYINTIDWMAGSDIDMGIPEKIQTLDYMTLETESDTNFMIGIIVSAPVIVALAGIIIWLKRRNS